MAIKKILKIIPLFLYLTTFIYNLFAEPGKSGGNFLRIIQSPRAQAMAESGTALYGDSLSALALNPAATSLSKFREFSLAYSMWLEDITLEEFAYIYPTQKNGVFSIKASMLTTRPFESYDNQDTYLGKINSKDLSISSYYSRRLYGPFNDKRIGLFIGGGIKYFRETLDNISATASLFDLGILYLTKKDKGIFGIGASAQSVGNGFKFDTQKDPVPSVYRLGFSYITLLWGDTLSLAYDIK